MKKKQVVSLKDHATMMDALKMLYGRRVTDDRKDLSVIANGKSGTESVSEVDKDTTKI
jgi:hypothetical protein